MNRRATLLITTFNRDQLLLDGLTSVIAQNVEGLEVYVLNDGEEGRAKSIAEDCNVRYIHTGLTKNDFSDWRVPGYALNIGARRSAGSVIIISCAEIYHMGNPIEKIISTVESNPMAMAITNGLDDDGSFEINGDQYNKLPPLNTKLPFLMGLSRKNYFDIGGYDEDFKGHSRDDVDFVDRLTNYGCSYHIVGGLCVHLYHHRTFHDPEMVTKKQYNNAIYQQKRGTIVRNQEREWGKFDELIAVDK